MLKVFQQNKNQRKIFLDSFFESSSKAFKTFVDERKMSLTLFRIFRSPLFHTAAVVAVENGNGEQNIAGDKSGDDTDESKSDESDEGK